MVKKNPALGKAQPLNTAQTRLLHGIPVHEPAKGNLRDKNDLLKAMQFEEEDYDPHHDPHNNSPQASYGEEQIQDIPLDKVVASPYQPRLAFPAVAIQELAEAIQLANGLLQPVLLRPLPDGSYELVAGERRTRACRLLGYTTIKAIVREMSDEVASVVALMDNDARESLTAYERAKHLKRHCDTFAGGKQIELSKQTGVAPAVISRHFKFFMLPPEITGLLDKHPELVNEYQLPVILQLSMNDLENTVRGLEMVLAGAMQTNQIAAWIAKVHGTVSKPKEKNFKQNTFGVKSAAIKGKQLVIKCGDEAASEKLLADFSTWLESRKL